MRKLLERIALIRKKVVDALRCVALAFRTAEALFVASIVTISVGVWAIYPPAALIVLGSLSCGFTLLYLRKAGK